MLFIEDRILPGVIPSADYYVETLSLMYRKGSYSASFREAFDRILGPFESSGWVIVILFALLLLMCFVFFAYRYRPSGDASDMMKWMVNPREFIGFHQRLAWLLIPVGPTIYATVFVLLYELSVASSIFEGVSPLVTSLQQLAALRLDKFCSGWWRGFRKYFTKYGGQARSILDNCATLELLLSGTVDYIISWHANYEYWLHTPNLCDKVVSISLPKLEVGGNTTRDQSRSNCNLER